LPDAVQTRACQGSDRGGEAPAWAA